jgi:N-acetyl-alpha-D-glucosaminyl L-malate synthase BshA
MSRALSIAVVCFPGLGGSGVIASELARGLASRGHRVFVVATAMPERLRVNGVKFERVEVPSSPVFEHAPYDLCVASHLVSLSRREAIDLVHLHYAIPHASSALLAAQVLGTAAPAMIVTLHGTDVTRLGAHPSLHPVTAFALAACDGVTAPSQYLRAEAAERFGLPAERIQVISNFVDTERFAPPPVREPQRLAALFAHTGDPGPILFHVSNFRPIKRTLDLPLVLAAIRRTVPARMVLVGDGPDREAVMERASALGLAEAMCFLGRSDEFSNLLGHADGFVLPSETESFGVAALEAMAAGVPVFGYRVGGLPEVVTEAAGTLVPCGDIDALAAAIIAGIPDRTAGHARAEAYFRSDRVIATYETYFWRVLAGRTTGGR